MKKYSVTLSHIDTCLPCYLTDHHNREGESLVGCHVSNTSTWRDVKSEVYSENLPDDMPADLIEAAIDAEFEGEELDSVFDSSLESSDEDDGDSAQAWFLFQWEELESE